MTSRDFCFWFQGFLEVSDPQQGITPEQTEIIKNHLNLVFVHEIDPSYSKDQKVQDHMNKVHQGLAGRDEMKLHSKPPGYPGSMGGIYQDENGEKMRC